MGVAESSVRVISQDVGGGSDGLYVAAGSLYNFDELLQLDRSAVEPVGVPGDYSSR